VSTKKHRRMTQMPFAFYDKRTKHYNPDIPRETYLKKVLDFLLQSIDSKGNEGKTKRIRNSEINN
jgi:hypothetical protein